MWDQAGFDGLTVEVLSTHMSGVLLHLAAVSRFSYKSFSLICWQKGTLGILTTFTPITFFPPLLGRGGLHSLQPSKSSNTSCIDPGWESMVNQWAFLHWPPFFRYRHNLPWSPLALSQSYRLNEFSRQYPEYPVYVCIWPFTHMCRFLVAHCSQCVRGPGSS